MASSNEQAKIWAVRFTKRARADMEAAEDRLAELVGEDKAEAWATGLEDEAGKLAQFPTIWQIAEEDKLFKESIRRMLYRRTRSGPAYRVLFVLRENPDDAPTVAVLHVRHSAQAPMTQQEAWEIENSE